MASDDVARVTVVSRVNCHLCEVAKEAVARIAEETGAGWTEVDVDADPALLDEYSDLVPVILVDGKMHGYWRVEEDRLRGALQRTAAGSARRPPGDSLRKVREVVSCGWLISSGTGTAPCWTISRSS